MFMNVLMKPYNIKKNSSRYSMLRLPGMPRMSIASKDRGWLGWDREVARERKKLLRFTILERFARHTVNCPTDLNFPTTRQRRSSRCFVLQDSLCRK